jgi:hypothetical protein
MEVKMRLTKREGLELSTGSRNEVYKKHLNILIEDINLEINIFQQKET